MMFQYHPEILERFPTVVGGVMIAEGMTNPPSSDDLKAEYLQEHQKVLQNIGDTPLSELPSLAAWRGAFRAFGVDPTQYRSASEALLRRLTKKGDIPSINTLVDIGNLVSIRYALPVAVFDSLTPLTVQFADGTESFTPLGQAESEHPEVGEVIFADTQDIVAARRWCWRPSAGSAAHPQTTDAVITIEGHHDSAEAEIMSALEDLKVLLTRYASGSFRSTVLKA